MLLYDALNAPRLLSIGDIRYFPIESCYGMVESKSDLSSRAVIHDGLDKIASFKRLKCRGHSSLSPSNSFGILFAYTASLQWKSLFEAVEEWQANRDAREWPNAVVVLDQGIVAHADGRDVLLHTSEVALAKETKLWPIALSTDILLAFYLMLLDMLGGIMLGSAPLRAYAWLPITAGNTHSYSFLHGPIAETAVCQRHGPHLRTIDEESIERILAACPAGSDIEQHHLLNELYGGAFGKNATGRVFVYNPDQLPIPKLLERPSWIRNQGVVQPMNSLAYDAVAINDREYWLPQFYASRDRLIGGCKECDADDQFSSMTLDDWWQAHESMVAEVIKAASGAAGNSRSPLDGESKGDA